MIGSIPKDFIAELIARTDIVEIIDARVTLKKKGTNYSACCPFHNEKTPSFSVSHSKQFYHCFGCGAHGNAIGFLMAYDRLEFPEAVTALANHLGIPVPREAAQQKVHASHYELLAKIASYYQSQLQHSQTALVYLMNRGLSEKILKDFGVGFAPPGWDNLVKRLGNTQAAQANLIDTGMLIKNEQHKIYDRFRERIMIPIRDSQGRIIGFGGRTLGDDTPKYLNSPETPLFHKGRELYGFYEARQANRTLTYACIVEGYMDVIALHQCGITQAVATLGTAASTAHFQRLFRHTEKIVVCFDGDRAGKDAAWRALETSLSTIRDGLQVNFMFLPEGEDPDSFIRKQGQEAFQQCIENAISLPDFFFQTLSQQVNLDTVEGKAKLNKLGYPLIQKIRPGIFQTLMMNKLSELLGVAPEKIRSLHVGTVQRRPAVQARSLLKQMPNKTKLLSPIQLAITLLLQYPKLVEDPAVVLPDSIRMFKQPGAVTLVQLFDLVKSRQNLTTGAILENWRGSKVANRLAELAAWELLIPEKGLVAEFCDTLEKISQLEREDKIQTLLKTARQQELTAEEKKQLMTLLKERH
ncbi:MAG: primase [Gammaproteobacteria bacterium]|jgi:DNA primase|nr:primase [Gammaproteobacteria bacterium]